MSTQSVDGAIELFNRVIDNLQTYDKYTKNSSLIDVTKVARVEPLCLLDTDCVNLDYIKDIVLSLQSIFSGYYLQAVSLQGTTIDGVKIAKLLDPLNPSRGNIGLLSMESYKFKLPTIPNHDIAFEDTNLHLGGGSNPDVTEGLIQNNTLSVGKVYNVTISNGENKVVVPVAIRLLVNTIASSLLKDMFTNKDSFDMNLKERWHSYRSGKISFFKDLLLCNDLIDKHRKNLIKDKSGVYNTITKRETKSKLSGILDKNPSLAIASNIAIISTETASSIEYELGGKLKDMKTRKVMFDNTNLMILVVVDKSWERITYYYRGINESSNVSIKEIKTSGKEDNTLEFMKAFLQGSAAAL